MLSPSKALNGKGLIHVFLNFLAPSTASSCILLNVKSRDFSTVFVFQHQCYC